ncbi:MAG TPA: methyltransferase domain-containing protein [Acidobacteria bacterium]|nr:methyltransferase domain-containing protein [Acidobacteriota bacterium]
MPTKSARSSTASKTSLASPHPALDVSGPDRDEGGLTLADRVAALVDDFAPSAIEEIDERGETDTAHLRVFFSSAPDRDAAQVAVATACGPAVRTSTRSVADDGWAARSQADLRAIRVGRVIVAPPWDLATTMAAGADDVVVQIRPALGFGSGHHPTTRLALLGLQQVQLAGRDVLDLGTGSGVLAVAAVKLGARAAVGIDRDTDALGSAEESLVLNGVADQVELRSGSLADTRDTAPIVVANLTGATLTAQCQAISALSRPDGYLILSGILDTEARAVAAAYEPGGPCIWRAAEDEWVGMIFRKKAPEGPKPEA